MTQSLNPINDPPGPQPLSIYIIKIHTHVPGDRIQTRIHSVWLDKRKAEHHLTRLDNHPIYTSMSTTTTFHIETHLTADLANLNLTQT